MDRVLYAHIPGYFVGTFEQYCDCFGDVEGFSEILEAVHSSLFNYEGEVNFKWLAPDEVEAWVQSRD